ncbi:alpha/beta fold hydrolase [Actinomycetospora atypica]|uniref:Alpha/beta fold hydrolase n=1 Tax=Actinomycetospora atypica TaxID=1290095 RepID=A0ABV9YFJ9_9PSEU
MTAALRTLLVVALGVLTVLVVPSSATDACGADVPGLARRTVDTGVVDLDVAVGGPVDAPAVVLLHGFPETWRTWRTVAADLVADHRVVVPDLRGAGCSDLAPEAADGRTAYGPAALAADLDGLAAALDLAPAVVVGHDMGAMVALAWAHEAPARVRHLVLSGGGVPGAGLEELAPPHLAVFAGAPPGEIAARVAGHEREFLTRFVGGGPVVASGSRDDAVRAYSRPGRLDAAIGRYRGLVPDPRPLAVPATALEGGAPGISAATLPRVAPGAEVVVVPGAGHYLQEDRPLATAAAIREIAARP